MHKHQFVEATEKRGGDTVCTEDPRLSIGHIFFNLSNYIWQSLKDVQILEILGRQYVVPEHIWQISMFHVAIRRELTMCVDELRYRHTLL